MMKEYAQRREKLFNLMEDNSIAIIGSGVAPMKSLDESYEFFVDRNFYYLTGIDTENAILFLAKNGNTKIEKLFIERYDEYLAKWVGGRIKPEEAEKKSEIKDILYNDEFYGNLCSFLERRRYCKFKVYLDLWKNSCEQTVSFGHKMSEYIKTNYPQTDIEDIYENIAKLRMIKDENEILCIKDAIKATGRAFKVMISYARPLMNECEIEGAFDFELARQGKREHAFKTIVAGGVRGTTLHYSKNCEEVKDGELILVDAGCTSSHYCADISRTFPVNGCFTLRQKEIYNIVLNAQKIVFENAKPGITIKQLNDMVISYYEKELESAGLLNEGKTVKDYYFHNISHHLGLDTHDVSMGNEYPLEPGMVITVEPGLYIEEEKIGIRIEDDILITDGKAIILSEEIPKLPEHIEIIQNKFVEE